MSQRLIPLEGCRGIASIIVLIHHFLLGFCPNLSGVLPISRDNSSIIGKWYFFFINGTGAVFFFFVLSGFVLCHQYFQNGDSLVLKRGAFKRLPRLAGPVLITNLISFLLLYFNLIFIENASKISGSTWLMDRWGFNITPNFVNSMIQGLTTFITGEASYNTNLWTMKPEFLGSITVFLIAPFLLPIFRSKNTFYLIFIFLLSILWSLSINNYLLPFIIGVFLSAFNRYNTIKITIYGSTMFIILGLYFLGFAIPEKDYVWVIFIQNPSILKNNIQVILNSIGACLIISAIIWNQWIYDFLNNKISILLGSLSFPIYLVHTLVICSVSSYLLIFLSDRGISYQIILIYLFLITLTSSVIASIPLIVFDGYWVKLMNRLTRML